MIILFNQFEFINKIDGYKENVDYSKITDEVLKEIKSRNFIFPQSNCKV